MTTSNFEITIKDPAGNQSAVYGGAAVARGTALGSSADGYYDLASGTNFIGFLTRDVVAAGSGPTGSFTTGLTLAQRIYGVPGTTPVGFETPFTVGYEVSVEKGHEAEVEGTDLIMTSGSGLINASTAVGTKLSFKGGKVYVAQTNDVVYYTLSANNLTPVTTSALRIRIQKV